MCEIKREKEKRRREALKVANDDYRAIGIGPCGGTIGRRHGHVLGRGDGGAHGRDDGGGDGALG